MVYILKPRPFIKPTTLCFLNKFLYLVQTLCNSMDFHFQVWIMSDSSFRLEINFWENESNIFSSNKIIEFYYVWILMYHTSYE